MLATYVVHETFYKILLYFRQWVSFVLFYNVDQLIYLWVYLFNLSINVILCASLIEVGLCVLSEQ